MKVVQVMNALDDADAVSQYLLELDALLRQLGHQTEIYSQFAHPALKHRRRPVRELPGAQGDLLLFHYAGYSQALGLVARFPGRRGVVYQNVTPAEFFCDVPKTYEFCRKGRNQVAMLPGIFHFGIGVSRFNARELEEVGFEHVRTLPIPWESSGLADVEPDPDVLERYGRGPPTLLMVGRLAPHKGAHYAVRALPAIEERVGEKVRLVLVGKTKDYGNYRRKLQREIRESRVGDRVIIAGEATTRALTAYYRTARALLVLSDHEGFCVPITEAGAFGVPVVAYDAGAVAETLGEGGVRIDSREPDRIAEAVGRVYEEGEERGSVIRRARLHGRAYSRDAVRERLRDVLTWVQTLTEPRPSDDWLPSFSIVVCTYNRDRMLEGCLRALERLEYPRFEIVVVNGPSTDRTSEVLSRFPGIKRVENPHRNLSISRNLGIAASAGDIVAFIDDDAVPAPDWLNVLADAYRDPIVGAAGGRVHGPGGDHLQFANGVISRGGLPRAVQEWPDDHNAADGEWFNILMGTNASFRRGVLEEVGGFDENYEYYHDEADLCVRVIRTGFRVEHVADADVWHEFAASAVRKTVRDVNWTVVVKNTIYFYFKTNSWQRRPWDWIQPMPACLVHFGIFARWFVHGEISIVTFLRSLARWAAGIPQGYLKGWFLAARRRLASRREDRADRFMRYSAARAVIGRRRLHVALVSQQYPPDACGGIGVYTERLAEGLVEAGHQVSVVAHGARPSVVWRRGVKVHRVVNASPPRRIPFTYRMTRKNVGRSLAVDRLILELVRGEDLDLVEGPLWDAETFVLGLSRRVPLVIRVETPMALAIETQGWERTKDLELACEMEWAALRASDGVIDASGTVLDTLAEKFGVRPEGAAIREIAFGVHGPETLSADTRPDRVCILFLGRLEPRKGIDVLARAMPRVLRECPEAEFHVAGEFVNGQGPRDIVGDLDDDHGGRVRFYGRVDDETRSELYRRCDVFVAPSRYESFGIVYIEAMSYGKPVVACDVGGARRIVVNGETGVLVPPGDSEALAEALVRLSKSPEDRHRLGKSARERAIRSYSVEAMVRQTIEFYEEILDRDARRRSAV